MRYFVFGSCREQEWRNSFNGRLLLLAGRHDFVVAVVTAPRDDVGIGSDEKASASKTRVASRRMTAKLKGYRIAMVD